MAYIKTNGTIACEMSGPVNGEPLLLIHGVGAQLVRWPSELLGYMAVGGMAHDLPAQRCALFASLIVANSARAS